MSAHNISQAATAVPLQVMEEAAKRIASGFIRSSLEITLGDATIVLLAACKDYPWLAVRKVIHELVLAGVTQPDQDAVKEYLSELSAVYLRAQFHTIISELTGEPNDY